MFGSYLPLGNESSIETLHSPFYLFTRGMLIPFGSLVCCNMSFIVKVREKKNSTRDPNKSTCRIIKF